MYQGRVVFVDRISKSALTFFIPSPEVFPTFCRFMKVAEVEALPIGKGRLLTVGELEVGEIHMFFLNPGGHVPCVFHLVLTQTYSSVVFVCAPSD